jgi:hypothetical protein
MGTDVIELHADRLGPDLAAPALARALTVAISVGANATSGPWICLDPTGR